MNDKRSDIIRSTMNDPVKVSRVTTTKYSQSTKGSKSKSKSITKDNVKVSQVKNPSQFTSQTSVQKTKNGKMREKKASFSSYSDPSLNATSVTRNSGSERIVQGKRASNVYGRVSNRLNNKK